MKAAAIRSTKLTNVMLDVNVFVTHLGHAASLVAAALLHLAAPAALQGQQHIHGNIIQLTGPLQLSPGSSGIAGGCCAAASASASSSTAQPPASSQSSFC
jgi:hypothetical protein